MRTKYLVLDALGFAVAGVIAAASVAYPFARDHGELSYVGLEWLRGTAVYRELWARRPPGAYALHGIAAALGNTTGIRLVDIASVFVIGVACVAAVVRPRERAGLRGAACVLAATLAFGFFDFWDSGQGDLIVGALIAAATWAARSPRAGAQLMSGALVGCALTIAPWTVPLAVSILVFASGDRKRFLAGALAPVGVCAIALAARGDLGAAIAQASRGDCLRSPSPPAFDVARFLWDLYWHWFPFGALIVFLTLGALLMAWNRHPGRARSLLLPGAMCVSAAASVWLEGSLFAARRLIFVVPTIMLAAAVASVWTFQQLRARPLILANIVFAWWISPAFSPWLYQTSLTVRVLSRIDLADELDASFNRADRDFDFPAQLALGRWLASHSLPEDRVVVRGFEPQVYLMAGRRAGVRYFATPVLTAPQCMLIGMSQAEEDDLAELQQKRPRFIVGLKAAALGPDSPARLEALGYERRAEIGGFEVYESTSVGTSLP